VSACRPVFSSEAATTLARLSKRRERKALRLVNELAAHPFLRSDYTLPDESGRPIEYLLIDEFVFAYWIDHATRELRDIDIQDAS
jgi:hypothetical protein